MPASGEAAEEAPAALAAAAAPLTPGTAPPGEAGGSSGGGWASASPASSEQGQEELEEEASGGGYDSSSVRLHARIVMAATRCVPARASQLHGLPPPPAAQAAPAPAQESEPDLADIVARLKAVLSVSEEAEVQLVRLESAAALVRPPQPPLLLTFCTAPPSRVRRR